MKFTLKKNISRRILLICGLLSILITILSVYLLSDLITKITEKSNEEIAQRSFLKKHEIVSQEFSKFLDEETQVNHILKISSPENLPNNLSVLSSILTSNPIVANNWFQINNDPIQFVSTSNTTAQKNSISDFIAKTGNAENANFIIQDGKELLWRIYFKLVSKNKTTVRYGYDINLKSLHNYFSTVDQNATNYAFVFDKNGICLFHPDAELMGKNIFKTTNLVASDTAFSSPKEFSKKIALSEYLKLDVIRYTQRLGIKESDWYISVNFPKEIADENVASVKKYAFGIYLVTTIILLFMFYLFTRVNRNTYLEKESLTKEKNNLLLENEKINKEKALIQLQQLKEQINPHFLFNSLNSLYMLINSNGETAKKFTLNLSRIYRYLIDPPEENIVLLKDELLFIEKYIFLQQTRFKEELVFTIKIEDESSLNKKIPYLSFQIALENAIKHNLATLEMPLEIQIIIREKQAIVINNLQKKLNTEPSTKFGLNYLRSIYNYYAKSDFEAYEKDGFFICIFPLIEKNTHSLLKKSHSLPFIFF